MHDFSITSDMTAKARKSVSTSEKHRFGGQFSKRFNPAWTKSTAILSFAIGFQEPRASFIEGKRKSRSVGPSQGLIKSTYDILSCSEEAISICFKAPRDQSHARESDQRVSPYQLGV